jgi:2-phospho-L-lactate guanylyltransferase
MSDTSLPPVFGLVVPVKRAAVAKSRLAPLGDEARRELVVAFALDTVLAALECPLVAELLVVTDDVRLAAGLRDHGVRSVPDGESGSLNATLCQGAAELVRAAGVLMPVALCADLPALRPDELTRALHAAQATASFVVDADGAGTTMYAAPALAAFRPRFGTSSREAHLTDGAADIRLSDIDSLRRDVDTPDDLRAAVAMGVGPRTSWVVTSRRLLD